MQEPRHEGPAEFARELLVPQPPGALEGRAELRHGRDRIGILGHEVEELPHPHPHEALRRRVLEPRAPVVAVEGGAADDPVRPRDEDVVLPAQHVIEDPPLLVLARDEFAYRRHRHGVEGVAQGSAEMEVDPTQYRERSAQPVLLLDQAIVLVVPPVVGVLVIHRIVIFRPPPFLSSVQKPLEQSTKVVEERIGRACEHGGRELSSGVVVDDSDVCGIADRSSRGGRIIITAPSEQEEAIGQCRHSVRERPPRGRAVVVVIVVFGAAMIAPFSAAVAVEEIARQGARRTVAYRPRPLEGAGESPFVQHLEGGERRRRRRLVRRCGHGVHDTDCCYILSSLR